MRLGSQVAVAMTPSLGTSICHGGGPKKQKKKKESCHINGVDLRESKEI